MTDNLENWHCPECGGVSYYWHYTDENGEGQIAVLPSIPDMSAIPRAIEATREKQALIQEFADPEKWGKGVPK